MDDKNIKEKFEEFIAEMKQHKPNDRSDRDRYWAIAITDIEKAYAVFVTFALKE